jgi:multimeric flavodoxin WrbA
MKAFKISDFEAPETVKIQRILTQRIEDSHALFPRVLVINSSPNKDKGNTAVILNPFLDGIKEEGAKVEIYCTKDLNIQPCMGEVSCWMKNPGKCILNDDMSWLAPKAIKADIIVLATPVYCDGINTHMQMFLERLLPRAMPSIELREGHTRHPHREITHGKLVLVSSCGLWELDNFDSMVSHIKAYCRNADLEFAGALLRPHALFLKRMLEQGAPVKDVIETARESGRQLVKGGRIPVDMQDTVSRPIISLDMFIRTYNQGVKRRQGDDV